MSKSVLILGIGNILWADEGFGVRAVEYLHKNFEFENNVSVIDGGTQGIYLVHLVEKAEILIVFDAIDYGLEPGTMKLIEGDQVPKFLGVKKMSLHQTGFQEVLAMAEMLGNYPKQLLLVGVQPVQLEDFGGSLREKTKNQIEPSVQAAMKWLEQFGIVGKKREVPLPPSESLAGEEVCLKKYESERPSDQLACRHGDERVLKDSNYNIKHKPHPVESENAISCDVDHRGQY